MSGGEEGPAGRPCPECGKPAAGNFCQHCGASMGGRFCNQCGTEIAAGARFCNQCGKPVGARPAPAAPAAPAAPVGGAMPGGPPRVGAQHRAAAAATFGGSNLPWWIAGVAMFTLILVVGWSAVRGGGAVSSRPSPMGGGQPAASGSNPAAGASAVDLSSMTPREAADKLFDHVMRDLSAGDSADAVAFQPMAVQAYERAEPLDLDGLFHMSLLQRMTDPAAALATAQRILEQDPDHILGLGAAAEAADQSGQPDLATKYYKHLLEVYDAQVTRNLPEYQAHSTLLPEMKSEAEAYVAGK